MAFSRRAGYRGVVATADRAEIVDRLVATTTLGTDGAVRVLDDVLALMSETIEQFVARRHLELQRDGHRNDEIFGLLTEECASWRFRAPSLSQRQLRRIVYG
jgi:hypothetical protein